MGLVCWKRKIFKVKSLFALYRKGNMRRVEGDEKVSKTLSFSFFGFLFSLSVSH